MRAIGTKSVGLALLILAGCAGASVKGLRYGATPSEVVARLGNPERKEKNDGHSETWLYRNLDEGDCAITFELGRVLDPPRCYGLGTSYIAVKNRISKDTPAPGTSPSPPSR